MAETKKDKKPKTFKKGDEVQWSSHGNTVKGTVKKKVTKDVKDEKVGRRIKASKDEPQYIVKSDKSGGVAAHKPKALKKVKKGG